MSSWWPFGRRRKADQETAQQFKDMLQEALLSQGDLEEATEQMKRAREKRQERVESPSTSRIHLENKAT